MAGYTALVHRWSLSDLALGRPVMVGMVLCAVFLLGLIGLQRMPLAFMPTADMPRISVRVNITRTSPEVLEREVIRPIEEQVAGIRGLKRIQVGSGSWGVRMNLEFVPGTDGDAAKLELRDRLERVRPNLPEMVQRIEINSYTNNDDPVIRVRIASESDLTENYFLIEQRVARVLERIDGVARVELEGVSAHELEVAVDLEAVNRSGVELGDVSNSVRTASRGRSLGLLYQDRRNPGVRTPAVTADIDRFAELPLRRWRPQVEPAVGTMVPEAQTTDDAGFAKLGEIADVSIHPQEMRRRVRLNGRPAITVEVFANAGASAVDISTDVRQAVADMSSDPALSGLEVSIQHDQGEIILQTLTDLRNTGIWGGLLGIVVLYAFLHRWRSTLAASVSIPLSILAACALLFMRGEELNCIVLLGLVLGVGMLIDNAVVIVESIELHARRGKPPLKAAIDGAREVGLATMASTLSSVIVFLPLMMGESSDPMTTYLKPLGMTFAIGLVASLFVSQTAVPLIMGKILKPRAREVRHPILDRLSEAYASLLGFTLRYRRLAVLVGLCLAGTAALPATQSHYRFGEPDEQSDNLPIRVQLKGSRGYKLVGERVEVMEQAVMGRRDELGIRTLSCSYRDWGANCRAYPSIAIESEAEMEAFQERIEAVLPDQPGTKYRLGERDGHWRENRDRKVVEFAIKGEDMGSLMELSNDVAQHLRATLQRGSIDDPDSGGYDQITTPYSEGAREMHVQVDGERINRLGLRTTDVAQAVSLAFQGVPLGQVRGEDGQISLRLSTGQKNTGGKPLAEGDEGPSVADLRDLKIPLPDGSEVPLTSIARLEETRAPWWIQRVDRQTEVRIQVRFVNADQRTNRKTVYAALDEFDFPPGYGYGQGTQWWKKGEANNEMIINLGLCLLLVYAVMASLFESFLQPFAILVTCILGGFGAPWAMYATGTTVDTVALIGAFILIGIVVNNGIMLVDKVTQLRARGIPRDEALMMAGKDRLRPILMTATTTILGLVPMLIHHPTLAGVYYHSIAIMIAGGLATSTVITLVFLPAVYSLLEDVSLAARWRFRKWAG